MLHKSRGVETRNLLKEDLTEMQKMIKSYIHTFQTMEEQKTITYKQKDLLKYLLDLQKLLNETKLKASNNNDSSFWEWMENGGSFLFLLKGSKHI